MKAQEFKQFQWLLKLLEECGEIPCTSDKVKKVKILSMPDILTYQILCPKDAIVNINQVQLNEIICRYAVVNEHHK